MKFTEGTGKVMNTVPPNDFSYFELINDLVQKEPAEALDPEIMGSLAAIGIVKGKPFKPDARMKQILTDAAAIGTAAGRTLCWKARPSEGWYYYPDSAWTNMLFAGGYTFETPPPEVARRRHDHPNPSTGYRMLNARTGFFFYATGITPAMIMRLTGIGSQYLASFVDANGDYFDGGKTYKMTLPPNIPAEKFWSLTLYDNQTRSMLDTPQRYPRAGNQSYPSPAAEPNADGSTTIYFGPKQPEGIKRGNWIQTTPGKGEHDPTFLQPARTVLHQAARLVDERELTRHRPRRRVSQPLPLAATSPRRKWKRIVLFRPLQRLSVARGGAEWC